MFGVINTADTPQRFIDGWYYRRNLSVHQLMHIWSYNDGVFRETKTSNYSFTPLIFLGIITRKRKTLNDFSYWPYINGYMLHNLTIQITGLYSCQLKSLTIYIHMCVCVKEETGLKFLKEKEQNVNRQLTCNWKELKSIFILFKYDTDIDLIHVEHRHKILII